MEKEETIYYYAKYLQAEQAKCVLTRENWESKDWDIAYIDYIKSFNSFMDATEEKEFAKVTSEQLIVTLKRMASEEIVKIYKRLYKDFILKLPQKKKDDTILITEITNKATNAQNDYPLNPEYIKIIRGIEEEIYGS